MRSKAANPTNKLIYVACLPLLIVKFRAYYPTTHTMWMQTNSIYRSIFHIMSLLIHHIIMIYELNFCFNKNRNIVQII